MHGRQYDWAMAPRMLCSQNRFNQRKLARLEKVKLKASSAQPSENGSSSMKSSEKAPKVEFWTRSKQKPMQNRHKPSKKTRGKSKWLQKLEEHMHGRVNQRRMHSEKNTTKGVGAAGQPAGNDYHCTYLSIILSFYLSLHIHIYVYVCTCPSIFLSLYVHKHTCI